MAGDVVEMPTVDAEWRAEFGAHWRWYLLGLTLLLALSGVAAPLADPDLPMHLAMGRWIVGHHGVPFVEPFAWTRQGAPYFAYSWLPQVTYHVLYDAVGPIGLRLLQGLLMAAVLLAPLALARAARWSPWTGLFLALFNSMVAFMIAGYLRPQLVLFIAMPLAWACAYWIVRGDRPARAALGMTVVVAAAANSHLGFPVTAATWALLVTTLAPRDWKRGLLLVGSTVAGWLLSPYTLVWPDVFRLNFAQNAMLNYPTPISEFRPGSHSGGGALMLAATLALLPWALATVPLRARERLVAAAQWLVGLYAFSLVSRGILVWWVLSLGPMGVIADRLARAPKSLFVRRAQMIMVYVLALIFFTRQAASLAQPWARADFTDRYAIGFELHRRTAPLNSWLDCHTRPDVRGRLLTIFDLGSYFTWRLPRYSASIDSRTIFPDSVARPEGFHHSSRGALPLGPWASADLAVVPVNYAVAAVLDTAAGWRQAAVTDSTADYRPLGLWVRTAWWERAGRTPLPARVLELTPADAGRACEK